MSLCAVVLVHCRVWPLQTEWGSEGLRRRVAVVLWGTCGESVTPFFCSHIKMGLLVNVSPADLSPTSLSSTRCLTSRSTGRLFPKSVLCSRTRTKPTSPSTLCPRASRTPSLSWGITSVVHCDSVAETAAAYPQFFILFFIFNSTRRYSATIKRPFAVRYEPFTCSVEVLDQPKKIQNALSQMREELKTLHSALEKLSSSWGLEKIVWKREERHSCTESWLL